ncbi:unnamed protein product [Pleuronectes platessa]|uniref:Uncharacterized protein n=1 Tax=Pleuronectes platessa TaxID=8262 RepID=A0A9N7VE52_PLEPL|nr:unnamed protein product [Pleuronectes platessa]
MRPITSLTDYERNRIAGDTELFSPKNKERDEEELKEDCSESKTLRDLTEKLPFRDAPNSADSLRRQQFHNVAIRWGQKHHCHVHSLMVNVPMGSPQHMS